MESSSPSADSLRQCWRVARRERRLRWRRFKRERRLRPFLLAVATVNVMLLVFCVGYMLWNPCPLIEEPADAKAKILAVTTSPGYSPFDRLGARTIRNLCRIDALLRPGNDTFRHLRFGEVIADTERHESFYIFSTDYTHTYVAYVVRNGELMPYAKFPLSMGGG